MVDEQATTEERAAVFTFKKREAPMALELDLDAVTWEDNLRFTEVQSKVEKGEISDKEMLESLTDLLSKIAQTDVRKLPSRVVSEILQEFQKLAEVRTEEQKN